MSIGSAIFAVLFAAYLWWEYHRRVWPVQRRRAAVAAGFGRRPTRTVWLSRTGLSAAEVIVVAAECGYRFEGSRYYRGRRMTFVRVAPPGAFPVPVPRTTPGVNGVGR